MPTPVLPFIDDFRTKLIVFSTWSGSPWRRQHPWEGCPSPSGPGFSAVFTSIPSAIWQSLPWPCHCSSGITSERLTSEHLLWPWPLFRLTYAGTPTTPSSLPAGPIPWRCLMFTTYYRAFASLHIRLRFHGLSPCAQLSRHQLPCCSLPPGTRLGNLTPNQNS